VAQGQRGRRSSWLAVVTIILGFAVGGVGMVLGPAIWVMVVGAVVIAAGGVLGLASGIMNDWH
jgi:hypothetical protein